MPSLPWLIHSESGITVPQWTKKIFANKNFIWSENQKFFSLLWIFSTLMVACNHLVTCNYSFFIQCFFVRVSQSFLFLFFHFCRTHFNETLAYIELERMFAQKFIRQRQHITLFSFNLNCWQGSASKDVCLFFSLCNRHCNLCYKCMQRSSKTYEHCLWMQKIWLRNQSKKDFICGSECSKRVEMHGLVLRIYVCVNP